MNALVNVSIQFLVPVDAHAQHHHALTRELALKLVERGKFDQAGLAPGGPEVQDQQLPPEVVARDGATLVRNHAKFGSSVTRFNDALFERPGHNINETDGKHGEHAEEDPV